VEHLKGALLGQAQALLANSRQGWKGLSQTNTLAYYENPQITAVKSIMTHAPGTYIIKPVYSRKIRILVLSWSVCSWQAYPV
jgi:hypothetical protein